MKVSSKSRVKILFIFFFIVLINSSGICQISGINNFQFISPVPNSEMNSPGTNIIIKFGTAYILSDDPSKNNFEVIGEKSGIHSGKIILAEEDKTILFKPDSRFDEGEIVTVKLMKTHGNKTLPDLQFKFRITEKDLNSLAKEDPANFYRQTVLEFFESSEPVIQQQYFSLMEIKDTLPADFPNIIIDVYNNPSPGNFFFTPFTSTTFSGTYLIIADNYGTPVFYRKMHTQTFDFKRQPNGFLTYFDASKAQFYVMDSSYNIIDSVSTGNGYVTDPHDLLITRNNHYLLMSYDNQHVRMDTIIDGGNPNAIVTGLIIQELDQDKNVVFQWRSWDHYQITDATYDNDLRGSYIDYVHGNAIEVDKDGSLLISCRHMDEVTKINRPTGEIIWRLGGEYCKNNQFDFYRDPVGFSHQHDIRRLANGNITVFDNGNLHDPPFSRTVEYQLDEINKKAILVWQYRNDPQTFSFAMGCMRELENKNRVIGWGWRNSPPSITEVDQSGNIALQLDLPDTMQNYRAFKFPWKTNLFYGDPDSLDFGNVVERDSLIKFLRIINNSDQNLVINDSFNRDSSFKVLSSLPIYIRPFATDSISILFAPKQPKIYSDELHLRWNSNFQRIACVVKLSGTGDSSTVYVNDDFSNFDFELNQNYPNPFNPNTRINYSIGEREFVSITVYDILGNEIATLVNEEKPPGKYEIDFNGENLSSGIYFYKLQAGSFIQTRKMILLR
jgi:Arylsulfotransferase (ASST)/Secretion system C-terminal sorting domain/Cep192 domain 4